MKTQRLAFLAMSAAALLPSMTSCSSDANPFDSQLPTEPTTSIIQLRLNVEETRAGNMSTSDESLIKNVTVHIFDEKNNLETTKKATVTGGSNIINFEVSPGHKTLYVVTAKSNVNPSLGTSLEKYQNSTFNSSLENIMTDSDGFVMVGKSEEQQVMISASPDNLPASNIFDIKLERLVAKAQVKKGTVDGSSFGISFGDASFRAFQLSQRMMVYNNGSDVFETYVDTNKNGTYDSYTLGVGDYQDAVTSDFTAENCAYMSENIVSKPLSGNTTFLSIRLATTPEKYYAFDSSKASLSTLTETPAPSATYYAVGYQDKENGLVDYAIDVRNNHILTFKTEADAVSYMNSLNSGDAPAITVSQAEHPLTAPSGMRKASASGSFEVVTFTDGYAYYRVNIAHNVQSGDKTLQRKMVMRNVFYKVNINSVKSLGFSTEDLLRPHNPEAVLDAEGSSWISASISVADWKEVSQNVDL